MRNCVGSAVQRRTAADETQLACLVLALCLAFGLRALLLIDSTALWSDELYSVGKSFQPSFSSLLAMLREDTHPLLITPCFGAGDIWSVRAQSACASCPGWRTWPVVS